MHFRWKTLGGLALLGILGVLGWHFLQGRAPHDRHVGGMNHSAMSSSGVQPAEGGQATFAALIEIVALLEKDTITNWSEIDIDGLRSHLLDMNHVILNTSASKVVTGDLQIRFDVQGTSESIASIHRMVPAHSRFIEQSRGWSIQPELNDTGATVSITVEDPAAIDRLVGLGFYGFMSLDSHHQAHHYQMAIGQSHH